MASKRAELIQLIKQGEARTAGLRRELHDLNVEQCKLKVGDTVCIQVGWAGFGKPDRHEPAVVQRIHFNDESGKPYSLIVKRIKRNGELYADTQTVYHWTAE